MTTGDEHTGQTEIKFPDIREQSGGVNLLYDRSHEANATPDALPQVSMTFAIPEIIASADCS
jgi:hypothetical protein